MTELQLLQRAAAGDFSPEVCAWVARAARAKLADVERGIDGPSFDRLLRLPTTGLQWRAAERDRRLTDAALLLDQVDTFAELCSSLAAAWSMFVSRGPWQSWREEEEPPRVPFEPAQLHVELFWASRWNGGDVMSARQLERRLDRHRLARKCRRPIPRL